MYLFIPENVFCAESADTGSCLRDDLFGRGGRIRTIGISGKQAIRKIMMRKTAFFRRYDGFAQECEARLRFLASAHCCFLVRVNACACILRKRRSAATGKALA